MRFRRDANLDPSQVTDMRGRSMGGPVLAGGGGIGVVALVIFVLYTVLSGGSGDLGALGSLDGQSVSTGPPSTLDQDCRTGQDANERQDCRIVADVNSIQAYWSRTVQGYRPAQTVFYTGTAQTGCGTASSQVGPFYCPADKRVYIDLGFFDELQSRFGPRAAPSPRPTSWRTSTGTTSRTCSGRSAARDKEAGPREGRSVQSSRRTATPASGPITPSRPASSSS